MDRGPTPDVIAAAVESGATGAKPAGARVRDHGPDVANAAVGGAAGQTAETAAGRKAAVVRAVAIVPAAPVAPEAAGWGPNTMTRAAVAAIVETAAVPVKMGADSWLTGTRAELAGEAAKAERAGASAARGVCLSSALTQAAPETEGWCRASSCTDQRRSQARSRGRRGATGAWEAVLAAGVDQRLLEPACVTAFGVPAPFEGSGAIAPNAAPWTVMHWMLAGEVRSGWEDLVLSACVLGTGAMARPDGVEPAATPGGGLQTVGPSVSPCRRAPGPGPRG